MKRLFLLPLLFVAFFCTNSTANNPGLESLDGIITIINAGAGTIVVDDYREALSVTVEVLDANDNVQYSTAANAGDTVSFPLTASSRKIRSTYFLGVDSGFIIVTEIVNP